MSASAPISPNPAGARPIVRRLVQVGSVVLLQAAVLFAAAGTLRYPAGWVYVVQYLAFIAANALILLPHHRELVAERSRAGENTKGWDRVIGLLLGVSLLAMLLVGGLDYRGGWTHDFPVVLRVAGFIVITAGYALFAWAMTANAYFATTVRIQGERGHQVAISGPYRLVRHPGYLGMLGYSVATPFLLGSWWALIPAVGLFVTLVVRTALEDATLQRELPGYLGFTRHTRYRLFPGIW